MNVYEEFKVIWQEFLAIYSRDESPHKDFI